MGTLKLPTGINDNYNERVDRIAHNFAPEIITRQIQLYIYIEQRKIEKTTRQSQVVEPGINLIAHDIRSPI